MFGQQQIIFTLLVIPGIIIGFTFHEFAHAFMADRLGDPTPRKQGRLTLSPAAHLDPIGLILLIILKFGWAKPVEINTRYFKNPRRDDILVSLAGPLGNLFIAVVFIFLLKVYDISGASQLTSGNIGAHLGNLLYATAWINVRLFLFNLLPVPPLDGFHIIAKLVPPRHYKILYTLEQYSMIVLIVLIVTNVTNYIIGIPAELILVNMMNIFNV